MNKLNIVGSRVPSIDAFSKVTGQVKYLQDMKFPGMLYGKVLRSPHPHALISSIDATRARELPGVRAVITGQDIPNLLYSPDPTYADKEILCSTKVRFVGDEVAAVAADTMEIAQQALKLIDVKYESLPAVFDPEMAIQKESPLVHDIKESNIVAKEEKDFGDVEKGFAEADYVFEDTFYSARQAHCCLETKGCIVQYGEGGKIIVWAPTQGLHNLRGQLAGALKIDKAKIQVLNTPMGGGFGQKVVMDTNIPIAVFLSKHTRRPVKIMNTREEEFTTARTGYDMKMHLKIGISRDGKMLAKQARVVMDNGAYSDQGFAVLRFAAVVFSMFYDCPNVSYHGYLAYTNHEPCTAFRGFGNQQICFPYESFLDQIAGKLGMDPMEIRLRNPNKQGHTLATNAFINTCSFNECIEETAKLSAWNEKRREFDRQDKDSRYKRGIGMAAMVHTGCSTRNSGFAGSGALVKISEDGIVSVITPIAELGQGGRTAIAQIVAEGLGARVEDIRVINTDTEITPFALGAFGSRQTFVDGHASLAAAMEAKKELLSAAAEMLNCEAGELEAVNGIVYFKNNPDGPNVNTRDVAQYIFTGQGRAISCSGRYFDETAPEGGRTKSFATYIPTYTFGCQTVEVEVDRETGKIKILKVVAVNDSGRTINPLLAEGQMEGAVAQGLGYAITEEYVMEQGRVKNGTFTDYKVLRAEDMPEMVIGFVETNDLGPYGLKGIGESGLVPTAAAVANAVYQATGILVRDLPLKPEKVLKALRNQQLNSRE